jgi:hypothetical protein
MTSGDQPPPIPANHRNPQPQPLESEDHLHNAAVQEAVQCTKSNVAAIQAQNIACGDWKECETKLLELRNKNSGNVWFRGQQDSNWKLDTTLERQDSERKYSVKGYLKILRRVKPEIEAFTDPEWCVEGGDWIDNPPPFCNSQGKLPYAYMAHLRHHSFPSPLLDWTASPYIAAYFAFRKAKHDNAIAIYVFVENIEALSKLPPCGPVIVPIAPNFTTSKRHFLQRSRYTACVRFEKDAWEFVAHQEVFKQQTQSVLWKFVVPATERVKVLSRLDQFNLNAYSLFGSEECLMETLAFREFEQQEGH